MVCGMQYLSSLTRDQPVPPAVEAWSATHWTAREVSREKLKTDRTWRFMVHEQFETWPNAPQPSHHESFQVPAVGHFALF